MDRRRFLTALGCASAVAVKPSLSWANTSVGDMTLSTLSDGYLTLPPDFIFAPMPKDELAGVLAPYQVDATSLTPECNLTLLRNGDRTILFDTGAGLEFMNTTGLLIDSLDAAGVAPEDVTDVIFTHAHPDHLWGVLDDFGDPLFYDATHHIGRIERDYWIDPNTVDTIGDARTTFAVGAKRRLEEIAGQLNVFEDGAEVVPGVIAQLTPGHTPGHMAFVVASGNDAALILGDAIGNDHVALARPEWNSGSDQDMETAAATRVKLIDQITTDDLQVVGFHFANGGLGRLSSEGGVRRFIAAE